MDVPIASAMPARRTFLRRVLLWIALILLTLLAAMGLFLGVGLWNATRPPVVERVELPLPGLPDDVRIRVLLIGDTHAGNPDMPRRRLERIVTQANATKPDLILLAGDYHAGKFIDWPGMRLEDALEPLAGLTAPMGVFAILGNHDQPYWTDWVLARQEGPKLLVNAHVDLGPLAVAGIDSISHSPDIDGALKGVPAGKPVLILLHEPELLLWRRPSRPALVLSGHTHGGQVILPLVGAPVDRILDGPPPCRRGLCTLRGQKVFVTSGIGTSWLPIRYGVPPEMVEITLYSGRKSATDK